MDAAFFFMVNRDFQNYVTSALPFLEGSKTASNNFRMQCKSIYDFCKASQGSMKPEPFPRLIIDGFDNEQIWGELELFNRKEASLCLKAVDVLTSNDADITVRETVIDEVSVDESEQKGNEEDQDSLDERSDLDEENEGLVDGFHFEESENEDDEAEEDKSDDDEGQLFKNNAERTEVDDEFFSLRKMEKFLDNEDKKYEMERTKQNDGDIDYFEDIPSSDDFESSENEETGGLASGPKSSRHLKYADYFNVPSKSAQLLKADAISKTKMLEYETTGKTHSPFERHQQQLSKKIEILENKALAPADWQMKGEIRAGSRPENSLLQETLQFDHVTRPPAEITEEHTKSLEDLIKQRIVDCAWDDVERKYKPEGNPSEYKKRILLDSSQSKLTLSEIYEKEYLEKTQKLGKKAQEEKESEEHVAIKKDMENLFRKLDALSNFHFIAPPPEPEIKLISNVPSIAKEETQPVTQTEAQMLAPEEVFAKSAGGEEKSTQEKTSTDKKRERRKKKLRLKARAEERLRKLKMLNPESDKVKSLDAINQLKKASKAPGSNTTVMKFTKKSGDKLTSQSFFSRLQQKEVSGYNKKQKAS